MNRYLVVDSLTGGSRPLPESLRLPRVPVAGDLISIEREWTARVDHVTLHATKPDETSWVIIAATRCRAFGDDSLLLRPEPWDRFPASPEDLWILHGHRPESWETASEPARECFRRQYECMAAANRTLIEERT